MDLADGSPNALSLNALSLARLQEQAFAFERAMTGLEGALDAAPQLETLPLAIGGPLQALQEAARAALRPEAGD